ncbi:hypothetical protein C1645_793302 [Glomus cerebriforme]|uniref:Uncharacterized protein n=1 Tax=Glomus cerebriforme TaxID=658196 RepID=A0A397S7S8_9GLOM|nr:hypothetical protein C1645_793302 [Glomus cerebriforme]
MDKLPALENDGAVLKLISDGKRYSFQNNQDLRKVLQQFVSNKNLKFTVFIEMLSKPFNSWTFPKVCELYGLSDNPNPSIDVHPIFHCGCIDLGSEKSKIMVKYLIAELKLRQDVIPLDKVYKVMKTIYSYCYLASGVSLYKDNFKHIPEKLIED